MGFLSSHTFKKASKWGGIGVALTLALADGGLLYNYAGSNKFVIKTTLGNISSDNLSSGIYLNVPFAQYTHDYNRQVQTLSFTTGGHYHIPFGASTEDQNSLLADMRLHYRVLPDKEKLGFHRWAMDGFVMPDGYWLLTQMMNDSANAVMGQATMAHTASHPEEYLQNFLEDFKIRIEQNNIPIEVQSVELKNFNTFLPSNMISYQKRDNQEKKPFVSP